jgi:hypothetical protein
MNVSIEQALSIFKKWEEEKSSVRLLFKGLSSGGMFTGKVFRSTPEEVVMIPPSEDTVTGDSSFITISFILADSFAFIDPRDGGEDRELLSGEMEFGIFVHFTSGERCTFPGLP